MFQPTEKICQPLLCHLHYENEDYFSNKIYNIIYVFSVIHVTLEILYLLTLLRSVEVVRLKSWNLI